MIAALLLAAATPPPEGPPWYSHLGMIAAILALGYFLLMRPAQRQEAQRRSLISALKKNDKVINSGGIIGVVDSIKDKEDEVILRGGVHITRSSIVRIVGPDEQAKE